MIRDHDDPTARVLTRLIEANPDLDADWLTSAYLARCDDDPAAWPMPYHCYERRADEIVLAYLQHYGTDAVGGPQGEHSERSINVLIEKTGMGRLALDAKDPAPVVVLPWPVLQEILWHHVLMAHVQAQPDGETAQDYFSRMTNQRLADNAAAWAWAEAHDDDPEVRTWIAVHRDHNPPDFRSSSSGISG